VKRWVEFLMVNIKYDDVVMPDCNLGIKTVTVEITLYGIV